MAGQKAPQQCPKCGGDMWDNIDTKKNPKAPDYACKDKQGCGAGVWLTDSQKNAARAAAPAQGSGKPQGNIVLDAMMYRCLESACKTLDKLVKDGKIQSWTVDNSLNLATTLFIARTRDRTGVLKREAMAAPPPPPPPPPVQQGAPGDGGYYDGGYYDGPGADDDLPF